MFGNLTGSNPGFTIQIFEFDDEILSLPSEFTGENLIETLVVPSINFPDSSDPFPDFPVDETFAVLVTAVLTIFQEGEYTFFLGSDEGSVLKLDNEIIINNDGVQIFTETSASVELPAGDFFLELQFFENT